jgi:hypothetical protein
MRRVVLFGPPATGKSTLARWLSTELAEPHTDLDDILFTAEGPLPLEEFRRQAAEITSTDGWIVEGNFSKLADVVWHRADTLIWLDFPLPLILYRITRRNLRQLAGREDSPQARRLTWSTAFFAAGHSCAPPSASTATTGPATPARWPRPPTSASRSYGSAARGRSGTGSSRQRKGRRRAAHERPGTPPALNQHLRDRHHAGAGKSHQPTSAPASDDPKEHNRVIPRNRPVINERDIAQQAGVPLATWRRRDAPAFRQRVPALFDSRVLVYDLAQAHAFLNGDPIPPLPTEPHPDDLLNDEEAAALLGVTPGTVRAYASQGYLPRGTTIYSLRLWTRRDIETRRDTPPRQGQGGGRPLGHSGPKKAHAYEGDPRLHIATEALTASPGTPRTHLAAALAKQHGSSPRTWERLLTQAARTPAQ